MQFSTVALFAATAAIVNAAELTQTVDSTTLATITSCGGSHASSCPASTVAAESSSAPAGNGTTSAGNGTSPGVSTYEAGAGKQYAAGAVALAAGALLAL
nr:uncharacterized protein [Candida metapsilosis]